MFYDRAKIFARSGNGGDGMISFRREKFVPRGGPDGGDGGTGASVILVVNPHMNSLVRYHRNSHFRAENGGHGGTRNKTGASGAPLRLEVPRGTVVRNAESREVLADLTAPGQEVVILQGGRGGRGNARFASSTNQAPRIAERGEPGEEAWLELELKLIADVGIIGVPNAGKSTLLASISAARPKIADYPFTTLAPNLGVVNPEGDDTFVAADIPGLIEGAAGGAGLGYEFLRHIERTRVLLHLLDGNAEDPLLDWAMVNQELALFDARLEDRPQLVVLNKIDLPHGRAQTSRVRERMAAEGVPFSAISAATGEGVQKMLYQLKQMLDEIPAAVEAPEEVAVIRPDVDADAFTIVREDDGWRVSGKSIERIAAMTYWEFEPTVLRFQQILERMGITEALTDAGVQEGDTVHIGDNTLEWSE